MREEALHGDVSLVKAWKGDAEGNLIFRKTSRNHNPAIATAGKVCIAEVEELVPTGELPPDGIHIPGTVVQPKPRSFTALLTPHSPLPLLSMQASTSTASYRVAATSGL